jgi:hypothetical protein
MPVIGIVAIATFGLFAMFADGMLLIYTGGAFPFATTGLAWALLGDRLRRFC